MLILAIDTSTDEAGVALARDEEITAEFSWRAAGNHSRHLPIAIRDVLDLSAAAIRDVEAVVVAVGPGSFSGIRVGVSAAKGIAMSLGAPLVGLSTLDAIAFQAPGSKGVILAVIPAGREQVFAARYEGERRQRVGEYRIVRPLELAGDIESGAFLAGPGAAFVSAQVGAQGRVATGSETLRRPGYLAELGRRHLVAGAEDQLHTIEPLYLRRSAAEEKRAASCQE